MKMKNGILLIVLIAACLNLNAQAESLQGPSLQKQFETIIAQSNSYQEYKVIKSGLLNGFWKNTNDSIKHILRNQVETKQVISEQQQEIKALKESLNSKGLSLQQSQSKIDSISVLGISFTKGSYNTFMWGLVLVLAAVLSFFVFKNKDFKKEAAYRIHLFQELTEEFREFKTKALEKEKRLARELQTERNNLEEMLLQQKV